MKTSYKLLIISAAGILVLITVGLLVVQKALRKELQHSDLEKHYQPVSVAAFTKVDFSDHWIVRIRQGQEYKVEVAVLKHDGLKPRLENKDGTLYFHAEPIPGAADFHALHVRVTAPFLETVKAIHGTRVRMVNFKADSLQVILENGGEFIGNATRFQKVSVQTSGKSNVRFTEDLLFTED